MPEVATKKASWSAVAFGEVEVHGHGEVQHLDVGQLRIVSEGRLLHQGDDAQLPDQRAATDATRIRPSCDLIGGGTGGRRVPRGVTGQILVEILLGVLGGIATRACPLARVQKHRAREEQKEQEPSASSRQDFKHVAVHG